MSPSIHSTCAAWLLATLRRPKARSCDPRRVPSWHRPRLRTRELGPSSIHSSLPFSIPDSVEEEVVVEVAAMVVEPAAVVARAAVATAAGPAEGRAVGTVEGRVEPPGEELVAPEADRV